MQLHPSRLLGGRHAERQAVGQILQGHIITAIDQRDRYGVFDQRVRAIPRRADVYLPCPPDPICRRWPLVLFRRSRREAPFGNRPRWPEWGRRAGTARTGLSPILRRTLCRERREEPTRRRHRALKGRLCPSRPGPVIPPGHECRRSSGRRKGGRGTYLPPGASGLSPHPRMSTRIAETWWMARSRANSTHARAGSGMGFSSAVQEDDEVA